MSDGPDIQPGDDEPTKRAKVTAWLEEAREQMRPHWEALAAHATDAASQLAADMGESYSTNKMYWGTMGNFLTFGGQRLNSGSPALHALHDLARSVPRRSADQWSAAMRKCEEMFDNIDGGETLGLGDGGLHYYPADDGPPRNWDDPVQVPDAMRIAAEFFSVPPLYAPPWGMSRRKSCG
jgi:hypothetical protein